MRQSWIPQIFFAGKVTRDGFRDQITGNSRSMSDGYQEYCYSGHRFRYGGPFAISCDHGCFHYNSTHGMASGWCCGSFKDAEGNDIMVERLESDPRYVVKRCLHQIMTADAMVAYLDSTDCYGTLVEMGYASAIGTPIFVVLSPQMKREEIWHATSGHTGFSGDVEYCREVCGDDITGVPSAAILKSTGEWSSEDGYFSIYRNQADKWTNTDLWYACSLPGIESITIQEMPYLDPEIFSYSRRRRLNSQTGLRVDW